MGSLFVVELPIFDGEMFISASFVEVHSKSPIFSDQNRHFFTGKVANALKMTIFSGKGRKITMFMGFLIAEVPASVPKKSSVGLDNAVPRSASRASCHAVRLAAAKMRRRSWASRRAWRVVTRPKGRDVSLMLKNREKNNHKVGPPSYLYWLINPMNTIVISTINHS